jgi:predicted O-methyltransferase YrrM
MTKRDVGRTAFLAAGLFVTAAMAQGIGCEAAGPGQQAPPTARAAGTGSGGEAELADKAPLERGPLASGEAERAILAVLDDMNANQRRHMMNVPVEDGRLLRLLTEAIGAKQVVEIGTSNGYSGIWICLGLRKTEGKLTTYEIDARRAGLARENFKRAGVERMVTLIEGDAHDEITKLSEPIDLLFLDADKSGYVDYLNKLLPLLKPGGLVVAHNMVRSVDPDYLEAITSNPDLETLFLNMDVAGVGVTLKKR